MVLIAQKCYMDGTSYALFYRSYDWVYTDTFNGATICLNCYKHYITSC
jgi:hypothetical protein